MLASFTTEAAVQYASGRFLTTGVTSTSVAFLLEGAMKAMFVTKLKFAVVAFGLIASGAVVVAQQGTRAPEAEARAAWVSEATWGPGFRSEAQHEATADDAAVTRELAQLDLDILAEEVQQLRRQVEVALRHKLLAERLHAGITAEGPGTQSQELREAQSCLKCHIVPVPRTVTQFHGIKEGQSAYESARASYLARSRELRSKQRRLGGDRIEDTKSGSSGSKSSAASIGSIDLEIVFSRYEKAQRAEREHQASRNAVKERLNKRMDQIKELSLQMEKAAPRSSDFNSLETQILAMKQQYESEREVANREFAEREARNTTSLLEEIQQAIAFVAKANGLNYVVKVSPEPKASSAPSGDVERDKPIGPLFRSSERPHRGGDPRAESPIPSCR